MSHDSIFLADEAQAPVEPVRILSQESVHGKIKALQMKLQQQNLRLGPPPLLIPGKRAEDTGVSSEDDGLPHSPPEISLSLPEGLARGTPKFPDTHRHLSSLSLAGTGSEEEEQVMQLPVCMLALSLRPAPCPPGRPPPPPRPPPPRRPAWTRQPRPVHPCLDNSAARHRMSVKPRNQRVSVKGRRLPSQHVSRPRSESLNALDRALPETDEEEEGEVPRDPIRLRSYSTQVIRSGEGGPAGPPGGEDTPAPSTTPTPTPAGLLSVSESGLPKSPMRRVQGVAREPVWPPAQPKTQPLPTPAVAAAAAAQQSTAPWRSSLKRNTTEQTQWDCLRPEPSQSVTAPPAGSDDQPSSEGADHGKPQGPGSGSFRFSIASAWDRPRGGSLLGREERRGAKSSSDSPEVPAGKPEEAKPRLQPLNPGSGGKGEGGPPVKASFPSSRREEETVAAPEEPKPKDQPRNLGLFQERTNPNARGKEGTAPGARLGAGGGRGSREAAPQALTPTKRPDLLKQHNVAAQGSQSLRREGEDRGAVPGHPCLKPPLHRTRTSPNSDPPASPAHPPSTPSSSTKCDHGDRERPGESKRGDDVDMPTDPSLDSGPAPKPASAPPKEAEPVVSEPVASEPAWMTMAREKTRSLQQMFTSRLPREFAVTTPTATPTATPKPSPQPVPLTPCPDPCARPRARPRTPARPTAPPSGHSIREGRQGAQGRADRGAPTEKTKNEKNEKTPLAESAAPPSDKRQERTDRSFPVGGKTEAKAAPAETHSTAAAAPHRAEAKMEGRLACRVHSSEAAPSSTPAQSREREDRQPVRPEVLSAAPAVSSGGQPSWMELAKRKSLAWSDKAMD
ncbi:hypothetical protein ANANG_G00273830 [Anguilla anguilla]|uniref:DUF4592 domain-containing protein n=1 Tax=Anguilla anguilla TaxID=7936 RepID=A0A9D3LMW8_ANGAN|nr:hypothetical protein ANANG_G00273830 [Anguilla anguilla]